MSKTLNFLKYQDDKVAGYNDAMKRPELQVAGAEHRKELVDFIVKFQRFLFAVTTFLIL
jgi:hypothetical protein